jgi:hypothetical protein
MKTKELIPTGHDLEIKTYASDSLRLGPKTGSRSKLAAFTISANLEAAIALSEVKPIGLAPTAGMSVTRRDRIVIFKSPETYYVGRAIGDPLLIDHKGMRPPLWQVAAHEGALYIVVEPIALFKEAMSQRGRRPRPFFWAGINLEADFEQWIEKLFKQPLAILPDRTGLDPLHYWHATDFMRGHLEYLYPLACVQDLKESAAKEVRDRCRARSIELATHTLVVRALVDPEPLAFLSGFGIRIEGLSLPLAAEKIALTKGDRWCSEIFDTLWLA